MLLSIADSFMGHVHISNAELRRSIVPRVDTHPKYALGATALTFLAKPRKTVLNLGGTEGSESLPEEVNQQDPIAAINEVDRLKKWNKDFENLPDVQTWNRACVALQVTCECVC